MQPQVVSCRVGQAGAGEIPAWEKTAGQESFKDTRSKLDVWKHRGHVRVTMGAGMVKKLGVQKLLVAGVLLLMAATFLRMHLGDFSTWSGDEAPARFLGTIDEEYYFQCDRSQVRTDICNLRGDIHLEDHNSTKSFVLYAAKGNTRKETLKPYPRKWEETSMGSVSEVSLKSQIGNSSRTKCDVQHTVPAVVFSTGGFTGNLYHEFNDGLIPLWISTQHLNREVVLVLSSFHDWWCEKYSELLAQITKYEIVDLEGDKRVHCFPEIAVGLPHHGELAVDPERMPAKETIRGLQDMFNRAYTPPTLAGLREKTKSNQSRKPRLTIIYRKKTRRFLNLENIVDLGQKLGFKVTLMSPRPTVQMKQLFWMLNRTDVLLGVHGAAMTHILFMKPEKVFIQVVPIGTDWAANEYYGAPAQHLGLHYMPYKITPEESSLSESYNATDRVMVDPESVSRQGWENVKRIYLEGQDVRLSLRRLRHVLTKAKALVLKQRDNHGHFG